ncbi:DUF4304 domain-containing protein [Asticcacaulis sp. 201]|uniref:DUF4304 domain-containing protein n=1 Tax=Asticcacaulis sp. 201 TaxID=3028787 RepID=UPI0029161A1B|nr:DUF4304 domain-containing protein [Asticcacaulis sp. 201]MDV6330446.1 DUF4304 domain-containing protein [Asticcacaulis sp. 201]
MDKKALEKMTDKYLSPYGMQKKSTSWYKETNDVLQIVNLQKSEFSNKFYLNIGLLPFGIAVYGMPRPKEHKFPIRIRMSALYPGTAALLENVLDLEYGVLSDSDREAKFSEIITRQLLPFLTEVSSKSDIKHAAIEGRFSGGLVNLMAKKQLGL